MCTGIGKPKMGTYFLKTFYSLSSDRFISICLMAIVDGSSFTWRNLFNRYHIRWNLFLTFRRNFETKFISANGKRWSTFHLQLRFDCIRMFFLRSSMSYSNCITVIFFVQFNKSVKHIAVTSHPTGCQTFQ